MAKEENIELIADPLRDMPYSSLLSLTTDPVRITVHRTPRTPPVSGHAGCCPQWVRIFGIVRLLPASPGPTPPYSDRLRRSSVGGVPPRRARQQRSMDPFALGV